MRFAGESARSGVMMSRSRRIGAVPWMNSRVRWSSLVTTLSPMMIRSPGLSSTLSAMTVSVPTCWRPCFRTIVNKRYTARRPDAVRLRARGNFPSAEQPQHVLVGLRGEREGSRGQRLAGLQREQARSLFVGVGQGQIVDAGLQRVDRLFGELGAILDDRHVGRVGRGLVLQRGERVVDVGKRDVDVVVVLERVL